MIFELFSIRAFDRFRRGIGWRNEMAYAARTQWIFELLERPTSGTVKLLRLQAIDQVRGPPAWRNMARRLRAVGRSYRLGSR